MNYIQKNHTGYTFDPEYKQIFQNKWTINIAYNDVIKMRNSGYISDIDMKIIKFLFKFTFATSEMLFRYLGPDESKLENLTAKLDKLVKNRILNKFMLVDEKVDDGSMKDDAYQIYCLDIGGRTLLEHYSNENTTNWATTVNMKGSEVITKHLVAGNFFIKLMETCPNKVVDFRLDQDYRIGKMNVSPTFEFWLNIEGVMRPYIGQIVRENDVPVYFRDLIIKIESILTTNAYKKYFPDLEEPPTLFLVSENDANLQEVVKTISKSTEIKSYRVTTDERMKKNLNESGVFLRFDEDSDSLKTAKLSIFNPA